MTRRRPRAPHRGWRPGAAPVVILLLFAAALRLTTSRPAPSPHRGDRGDRGSAVATAHTPERTLQATKPFAVDGDTLDAWCDGRRLRIRLRGVDCLEVHASEKARIQARTLGLSAAEVQAHGEAAKRFSAARVHGQSIALLLSAGLPNRDDYGRLLAYVSVGEIDLGAELLRHGLAETRREPHPRSDTYREIEAEARAAGRGIFGRTHPAVAP